MAFKVKTGEAWAGFTVASKVAALPGGAPRFCWALSKVKKALKAHADAFAEFRDKVVKEKGEPIKDEAGNDTGRVNLSPDVVTELTKAAEEPVEVDVAKVAVKPDDLPPKAAEVVSADEYEILGLFMDFEIEE
jgi:hypothetical protein